jgi:predicted metal-dependent hydrolase
MSNASALSIQIGRRQIPYKLVRSDSIKDLKLSMTMDEFRVTAPIEACESEVQLALSLKHKWIIENYAALQEKYEQTHKIARFCSGAKIPYWGRMSQLKTQLADVEVPSVTYKHAFHIVHPNYPTPKQHDEEIEKALHAFLKVRFTTDAQSFIRKYSSQLGVECKALRVTEMVNRWGSCSHTGHISLDWRLIYAPKRVSAYVVAHELSHLKINDHSSRFWNLLSTSFGDYRSEHDWLAKNEHLLGYKRIFLRCNDD